MKMIQWSLYLALFTLTAGTLIGQLYAEDRPLNILLITADDLGLQLGCYGDQHIHTPHLDRLASQGRLFERAYVAQASCSSSRSAMFTGLYPHTNGQYGLLNAGVGFRLHEPLEKKTIPVFLKQANYRTGIIGKLHVGPESTFPFDARIRVDTRDVRTVADRASTFLEEDGPFFLMVNYSDPHVIGNSSQPRKEAFPTQYKGVPETPLKMGQVPPLPFQKIDEPEQIKRTTQFYNAVQRFDSAIGMLLAELDAAGHADDTFVLVVGDHGPPFTRGKTTCYEAGVHVPMIVRWPGMFTQGDRSDALVSTVDILPTILEAAGQEPLEGLEGQSLSTSNDPNAVRKYLATEFHYHGRRPFFPRRSIRDDRFKLIHNLRAGKVEPPTRIDGDASPSMAESEKYAGTRVGKAYQRAANPPEYELFDLKNDPWEFDNLADDPQYAEPLLRLKQALLDWRQETNDPLLTPEGYKKVADYEASN